MKSIPIKQYRDFWDVPRIFLASKNDYLLLFDCKFDEKKEDYDDKYQVLVMPELTDNDLSDSWYHLSEKAVKYLGEIPINKVKFDKTDRQFIESEIVSETFGL
ncbi:MAG TPA: hypothetical protein VF596_17950 [Pyrinomonadaceae bacterium]|jgi:hypothetical protein